MDTGKRRTRVPPVPDIRACTFHEASGAFHVIYGDLTSAEVRLDELASSEGRRIAGCLVDEFRRGVIVLFMDGTVTSFSAEFPRYMRDPEYRRLVDNRRKRADDDLGIRVAHRVKAGREVHGWSVAELARRAGMAAPNVHRIEAGKHVPTMTTVVRLAQALEVPVEELVRAEASTTD